MKKVSSKSQQHIHKKQSNYTKTHATSCALNDVVTGRTRLAALSRDDHCAFFVVSSDTSSVFFPLTEQLVFQ